jgi:hypothetical protein
MRRQFGPAFDAYAARTHPVFSRFSPGRPMRAEVSTPHLQERFMTQRSARLTLKADAKRLPARSLARLRMGCGILAATLGMMLGPTAAWSQPRADAPATQSSSDQGVTVQVTLKPAGSAGNRWEFAVAFDTHSADLIDDLTQSASLTTSDGRTLKPVSWTPRHD